MAKGKVFNLSRGQALGVIKTYMSESKPKAGDWIKLDEFVEQKIEECRNRAEAWGYTGTIFGAREGITLRF